MHVASAVFVYHFLQRLTGRAWFLTHKNFKIACAFFAAVVHFMEKKDGHLTSICVYLSIQRTVA